MKDKHGKKHNNGAVAVQGNDGSRSEHSLTHLAANSVPVKLLSRLPWLDRLIALSVDLAPFVVVSIL